MTHALIHSSFKSTALRAGLVVAALVAAAGTARADGTVAVEVGTPVITNAVYRGGPVATVAVRGGYGHRGGYYRGGGWGWGVGVGIGTGLLLASPWYYPNVVVAPPTTVIVEQPPQTAAAPLPAQPSRPEPIIYPRNGQSPQQLETDRQECNRWATTQPQALTDSAVFMRAVDACMDGRGYTTK